jgi:hypothetical protein
MSLTLKYIPDVGISINGVELPWGIERELARRLLNDTYKSDDQVIDLSAEHDGNNDYIFHQKRDIYENYSVTSDKKPWEIDNLFFLGYDKNNLLSEVDVHAGLEIVVIDSTISFEQRLSEVVQYLQNISPEAIRSGDGEYFFKELKLTVSDERAMGGEGDNLGYFYCAANIDHLIEE